MMIRYFVINFGVNEKVEYILRLWWTLDKQLLTKNLLKKKSESSRFCLKSWRLKKNYENFFLLLRLYQTEFPCFDYIRNLKTPIIRSKESSLRVIIENVALPLKLIREIVKSTWMCSCGGRTNRGRKALLFISSFNFVMEIALHKAFIMKFLLLWTRNWLRWSSRSLISPYGETTTKAGKENIILGDVLIQIYGTMCTKEDKKWARSEKVCREQVAAPLWSWKINLNSATCFVVDNFCFIQFFIAKRWLNFVSFSRLNFYVLVHCVITKFPRSVFKVALYVFPVFSIISFSLHQNAARPPPGKTFLIPFCFCPPGPTPARPKINNKNLATFYSAHFSMLISRACFTASVAGKKTPRQTIFLMNYYFTSWAKVWKRWLIYGHHRNEITSGEASWGKLLCTKAIRLLQLYCFCAFPFESYELR